MHSDSPVETDVQARRVPLTKGIRKSGKRRIAAPIPENQQSAIEETAFLVAIPGMLKSLRKGRSEPLRKSAKEIEW